MRFLLTGADGFTGRHLGRYLQRFGYEVVSFQGDITDRRHVLAQIRQLGREVRCDFVVNLAAVAFSNEENSQAYYAVNTLGAVNLLEGLSDWQIKPKKVILASSANVYADIGDGVLSETSQVSPKSHYGMSKLAMEFMARNYFDVLPVVVARPFNYTGPGQELKFVVPKIADHFNRRESEIPLGNLDTWREYNDVRMVCDAYLKLALRGSPGEVYNIASGQACRLRDVIQVFEEMTGHRMQVKLDEELIRKNEVVRLCGDPQKLKSIDVDVSAWRLRDTLESMLSPSG